MSDEFIKERPTKRSKSRSNSRSPRKHAEAAQAKSVQVASARQVLLTNNMRALLLPTVSGTTKLRPSRAQRALDETRTELSIIAEEKDDDGVTEDGDNSSRSSVALVTPASCAS